MPWHSAEPGLILPHAHPIKGNESEVLEELKLGPIWGILQKSHWSVGAFSWLRKQIESCFLPNPDGFGVLFVWGFFCSIRNKVNYFYLIGFVCFFFFLLFSNNKRKNKGYGLITNAVVFLNNKSNLTLEPKLS